MFMRRFIAVALFIAGVALPVCAQRGGARGGFSSHPATGFHGGFTGSAPSGFSGNRFSASGSFAGRPSFRTTPSFPGSGFGATPARPSYRTTPSFATYRAPYSRDRYNGGGHNGGNHDRDGGNHDRGAHYRREYVWRYGAWSSYLVPVWTGPAYWGYPDTGFYDDSAASTGYAAPASDAEPANQDQSPPREPYYPAPALANPSSSPSPPPQGEDALMLMFKDGRPPLEIHNYALTRTTLYVLDQARRDIPVNEIDVAATQKVNRDAGIDFEFPGPSR